MTTKMHYLLTVLFLISIVNATTIFDHTQICVPNPENVAPITSITFQLVLSTYTQLIGPSTKIKFGDYGACCSGFCLHLSKTSQFMMRDDEDIDFVITPEAFEDAIAELEECTGQSAEAMVALFGTYPQSNIRARGRGADESRDEKRGQGRDWLSP
jgi:hypothetical protein